jgi:hypothetical protein
MLWTRHMGEHGASHPVDRIRRGARDVAIMGFRLSPAIVGSVIAILGCTTTHAFSKGGVHFVRREQTTGRGLITFLDPADGVPTELDKADEVEMLDGKRDYSPVYADDSMKPESLRLPAELRAVLGAIGRSTGGCTFSHIGKGRAISAGHCVAPLDVKVPGAQVFPASDSALNSSVAAWCAATKVEWGVLWGPDTAMSVSTCKQVVAAEWTRDRDFVLLELNDPPVTVLNAAFDGPPNIGAVVTALGYPWKRSLEWSGKCTTSFEEETHDLSKAGYLPSGWPTEFSHNCPTDKGSSGSPIIDLERHVMIGIHDGGSAAHKINWATFLYAVHR